MKQQVAVIFDMDGVLIDSYVAHLRSWQVMARENGRAMTEEDFAATFGRTSREIIAAWDGADLTEDAIEQMDARKEAAFREIIDEDFPAMPGVEAMLDRLAAAGVAMAVGSSGPPENVELVVERLGRRDALGAVVHGMDVARGKPDPQVFLIAAERLGVPPDRCVVVEDAPQGIEAARRAGMKAIGFPSTGRTAEHLHAADRIIRALDEITPEAIRDLIGG